MTSDWLEGVNDDISRRMFGGLNKEISILKRKKKKRESESRPKDSFNPSSISIH